MYVILAVDLFKNRTGLLETKILIFPLYYTENHDFMIDLFITMAALYQLSYDGARKVAFQPPRGKPNYTFQCIDACHVVNEVNFT